MALGFGCGAWFRLLNRWGRTLQISFLQPWLISGKGCVNLIWQIATAFVTKLKLYGWTKTLNCPTTALCSTWDSLETLFSFIYLLKKTKWHRKNHYFLLLLLRMRWMSMCTQQNWQDLVTTWLTLSMASL